MFNKFVISFILCSGLIFQPASAADPLACAPGDEAATALAICAIATGGCKAASKLAEGNAQRFLLGESCNAIAGEITGQGYDTSDFIGAAFTDYLNSEADKAMNDSDSGNQLIAFLLKGGLLVYKIQQFSQCVDTAAKKCRARWEAGSGQASRHQNNVSTASYTPPSSNYSSISDSAIRSAVQAHFSDDRKCNVDSTMAHYDSNIFYEKNYRTIDSVRNTKEAHCRKFTSDLRLEIRDKSIQVSNYEQNKNIKIAHYVVEFDVFSKEQQKRLVGATKVALLFRTDVRPIKIIGEIHEKISSEAR